ncbi:MAG TPA: hypothetical protein VFC13_16625, partial [Actinomycetes bacterium]|nr:hypothetical protein [Actinomycetes bacterium]
ARRRARKVAMRSRAGDAKRVVFEVTGQLAGLAPAQLVDARRVVTNTRRALAGDRAQPTGRLRAWWTSYRPASSGLPSCWTRPIPALPAGCLTGPAG